MWGAYQAKKHQACGKLHVKHVNPNAALFMSLEKSPWQWLVHNLIVDYGPCVDAAQQILRHRDICWGAFDKELTAWLSYWAAAHCMQDSLAMSEAPVAAAPIKASAAGRARRNMKDLKNH